MPHKILITGAGGFVGTYLIKELHQDPECEIFGSVFKSTSDISTLLSADHIIEGDLSDSNFTSELIQKTQPEVIYHLAALSVVGSSVDKAVSVMNTNTTISYNILEKLTRLPPNLLPSALPTSTVQSQTRPTLSTNRPPCAHSIPMPSQK